MKTLIFSLICLAATATLQSQETHQFIATAPDDAPAGGFGNAILLLTGQHLVISVEASPTYSRAAIHGPAEPGADAPIIYDFGQLSGAADSCCGTTVEVQLTLVQTQQLRAGLWYLLLNEAYRGQILLQGICQFQGTNAIQLASAIDGWNPTNQHPRDIRWGRATFGLTGSNLSYEVHLPALYTPYMAVIGNGEIQSLGGPPRYHLGTLPCQTILSNSQPGVIGLEAYPRCVMRGAVCLSEAEVNEFISGQWEIRLIGNSDPIPGGWSLWGNILPVDSDQDGIPDIRDACPNSASGAVVNADGCSIEQLCPCNRPWKNHGEYVNCIERTTAEFVNAGLITEADRRLRIKRATASDCGKRQ